MSLVPRIISQLNRKKQLASDILETPLRRCLNTWDLTLLGIGHMVGAGIFVLTGTVVKDVAGPSTMLSYLLAGFAALLSSLCYAEFGAKVPKAGSAYTYTYVTMGEFWAFIIGWNIILEHMLGAASVARAWSGSFDAMFGGAIKNGTLTHIGTITAPWLSDYPDFIAFLIVIVVMGFVSSGAKVSANVNSIFTVINIVVILLIIIIGFTLGDRKNWNVGGGYFPNGFAGVFAGAATCFYAFIGFEGIAVGGEEAKRPEKSIPIATGIAMGMVTLLYVGTSASLTLMIPYTDVDVAAPFPTAFAQRGLHWAKVIIAIGALMGITTSLIGGLFSLPRAVYAMSSDGLFFRIYSHVHPKTQIPIYAVAVFGSLSGLLALLLDIETLVEFLSIGTLLSFTLVAACVIILRYQPAANCQFKLKPEEDDDADAVDDALQGQEDVDSEKRRMMKTSQSHDDIGKLKRSFSGVPVISTMSPENTTVGATVLLGLFMLSFHMVLMLGLHHVQNAEWWAIVLLLLFGTGIIGSFCILLMHEQNKSFLNFQVPMVPYIPALSMFINIAMMLKLNYLTWIRLAIWLVIGLLIYFTYGMHHSLENKPLASYNQFINYGGEQSTATGKPDEQIHTQQPNDDEPITETEER